MKMGPAIVREAALVIGGAILAAWLIGQAPELRRWLHRQWGAPESGGCDCGRIG